MLRPAAFWSVVIASFAATAAAAEPVDFAHDVLPLLKARCAKCHTDGTYKGELSMDTRMALLKAKAVVPGKSAESELIRRVTSDDPLTRMPPEGAALSAKQVAVLRRWIDEGVSWQEGFSFKAAAPARPPALRAVTLPPVRRGRSNPIDRIVDAYFAERSLDWPEPIAEATFMRRAYLDLLGLLPAPAEQAAFLSGSRPDARRRLVEELLMRDRQYAEHWLTFWNDLLRNDYSGTGYIDGGRRQITGWLYDALMNNKPYDRFVRELIHPAPEAEGFVRGIKWRGRVNASQTREIQFAQNTAQVFLGINLKCASCHDSFIDDWKLADSYGMAAIVAEGPLEIHRCDKPTGQMAEAKFLYPQLGTVDSDAPRDERLRQTAELFTHPRNGRLPRTIVNRLWHRLMGRGLVEPVDVMQNAAWSEDLLDYLASDLVEHGYDLKRTLRLIVSSRTYQSRAMVRGKPVSPERYRFRGPEVRRMTAEQFVDAVWRITRTAPPKPAADVGDRGDEPVRAALVNADALMRTLGRPNRDQVVTTRPSELTMLPALDLSNGPILAGTLSRGAKNLREAHADASGEELIDWLYRSALCRPPAAAERSIARELLGEPPTEEGLADLLWALFMLPEFQMIR